MTDQSVLLVSTSAAMDGGLIGIADVATAMQVAEVKEKHRLIGGVAVMLHIQRLGLDLPLRATGDADFGVTRQVLQDQNLVEAVEALGYTKTHGNRWERKIDDRRTAAVDLLIPTYRTRARHTVRVGDVVTTEVPGLAEAFIRPPVPLDVELRLTDGTTRETTVVLPDAFATLALKARARTVRNEDRDAQDLWRCLEIAAADGVKPNEFDERLSFQELRDILVRQLGANGIAIPDITRGLQPDAATRLRTRIRALMTEVTGTSNDLSLNLRR